MSKIEGIKTGRIKNKRKNFNEVKSKKKKVYAGTMNKYSMILWIIMY